MKLGEIKYIVEIDFHSIRERVAARKLSMVHVSLEEQLADPLTQVLPKYSLLNGL